MFLAMNIEPDIINWIEAQKIISQMLEALSPKLLEEETLSLDIDKIIFQKPKLPPKYASFLATPLSLPLESTSSFPTPPPLKQSFAIARPVFIENFPSDDVFFEKEEAELLIRQVRAAVQSLPRTRFLPIPMKPFIKELEALIIAIFKQHEEPPLKKNQPFLRPHHISAPPVLTRPVDLKTQDCSLLRVIKSALRSVETKKPFFSDDRQPPEKPKISETKFLNLSKEAPHKPLLQEVAVISLAPYMEKSVFPARATQTKKKKEKRRPFDEETEEGESGSFSDFSFDFS